MAVVNHEFTRTVLEAGQRPLPILDLAALLSGDTAAANSLARDEYGLGAHSDTCFMAFLPHENEPGIQVMDASGEWFWPDTPADGIVINFGQFLERWSDDAVRATPHRVIPPLAGHRYSLPFFYSPNLGRRCECLPSCHSTDNPP